jgi:hypothetical protein
MKPDKWEELQAANVVVSIVSSPPGNTWATNAPLQGAIERGVPTFVLLHEDATDYLPDVIPDNVLVERWREMSDLGESIRILMEELYANCDANEIQFVGDHHATYRRKEGVDETVPGDS